MMVLLRSFAGQGVVIRISNAPDRLLDAGLGQAFGVADGQILRPAITVVDQGIARVHHAGVQGLLERVERQVGAKRVRHPPAHDAPGKGVDDKRDVNEPHPSRDVRQIREPQGVRARDLEHPVDPVAGHGSVATGGVVFTRRPRTTPRRPSSRAKQT